jgi:hypothetical protein
MADEEYEERPENELSDQEVVSRLNQYDTWLKRFRDNDNLASYRYLDANAPTVGAAEDYIDADDAYQDEADTPDYIPVGQPNYLAINNETKIAAIAMGRPALHVRAHENPEENEDAVPNAGEIVAKAWEQSWENGNWRRETQAGLQKLGICGLGVLWYRWDTRYGPCFEHVTSNRLLFDPHATNLLRMDAGGVKVRMSLREAIKKYDPDEEKGYFRSKPINPTAEDNRSLDTTVVTIRLYWDRDVEVHEYQSKVLHRSKNLYGEVPLIPIEGFNDPRGRLLPLGDNVFASGLNQQVVDLASVLSNMAKHGGQVTLADPNWFTPETKVALQEGQQQQIIFGQGPLNPQAVPMMRVSAESPSPAWTGARQEAQSALDGIQGVTPAQRGQQQPNVTATQAVMVEQKAGARPTQARADYEMWITRMARAYVSMMQKFAGPTPNDKGTKETVEIWKAFKAVYDVKVVEGSTSFNNPAADLQSSMQLFTTITQAFPLFETLAGQGLIDALPNMKQILGDVLRAASKQNLEQYWVKLPQQQGQQKPDPHHEKTVADLYDKAPPDVRRQIEQALGLQPSQVGETPDNSESEKGQSAVVKQLLDQQHEREMQGREHLHDLRKHILTQTEREANMGDGIDNAR